MGLRSRPLGTALCSPIGALDLLLRVKTVRRLLQGRRLYPALTTRGEANDPESAARRATDTTGPAIETGVKVVQLPKRNEGVRRREPVDRQSDRPGAGHRSQPGPDHRGGDTALGRSGKRDAFAFLVSLLVVMCTVAVLTIFVLGTSRRRARNRTGGGANAVRRHLPGALRATAARQAADRRAAGRMRRSTRPDWRRPSSWPSPSPTTPCSRRAPTSSANPRSALRRRRRLRLLRLVAVSTVVAPLVLYLLRPVSARKQLGRLQGWLRRHNRVILMIVFGFMGALFTAQGVVNLLH